MEEKPQFSTQIINNSSKEEDSDEEIYEKIEAPKFVDFTVPDAYRPDDRYWFCLRVGCDQKHEEELDSEAIYKNFVLRVMAARSPNIRLRKALGRNAMSTNVKCPLSAPAKSSKSRISRLAMISSISQKMIDDKGKIRAPPKFSSTPKAKVKQVAAKYLTTPRNKKCLPNPNSFRSVQTSNPTTVVVPKNRTVAKALVFQSPQKVTGIKTSAELHTPLTKICEGMKRLEITSNRKRILGYSSKASKDIRRNPEKSPKKVTGIKTSAELCTPLTKICEGMKRLEITSNRKRILGYSDKSSKAIRCNPENSVPIYSSRRQLSARKDKSRAKDSLPPRQNCEGQEAQLTRFKSKSKGNLSKQCSSMPKDMVENDSGDIEIDIKTRDGSTLDSSQINEENCHEVHLKTVRTTGNFDATDSSEKDLILSSDKPPSRENSGRLLSDAPISEMNSLPNSKGRDSEGNDLPGSHALNDEGDMGNEGIEPEHEKKSTLEKGGSSKEYTPIEVAGHENEVVDSDDKENCSAFDQNRDLNHKIKQSERKLLGRQTHDSKKKVAQPLDKKLKGGLTSIPTGAIVVKYIKPKPTNPRPFRLRTDERGILKEANLGRKILHVSPRKEAATISRFLGRNSQRRHGVQNEKWSEENKCIKDTVDDSEKESEKKNQEHEISKAAGLKTSKGEEESKKGEEEPKKAIITPQRSFESKHEEAKSMASVLEYGKDNTSKKSENSLRKIRSPSLQQQLLRPKGCFN